MPWMFTMTAKARWEAANTYDYDLIILDLMLPGLTGTEILEKVRRKNQHVADLDSHRARQHGRQSEKF